MIPTHRANTNPCPQIEAEMRAQIAEMNKAREEAKKRAAEVDKKDKAAKKKADDAVKVRG